MYSSATHGPAVMVSGNGISGGPPDYQWVLVLNKYQRDNLLALINAVGWGTPEGGIRDLVLMSTRQVHSGALATDLQWMDARSRSKAEDGSEIERFEQPI
jgi:hypothetical protein